MTQGTKVGAAESPLAATMAEIAALEASMRELLLSADKGIGAAGALLVTGFGLALSQRAPVIVIALPYGISAAFFFMLQKYIERQMRAGVKRWLEESANALLREDVFKQTRVLRRISRPDESAAAVVYGIGGFFVVAASFVAISQYRPPQFLEVLRNLWWLHIVGLAVCGFILAVAWRRMKSAEQEAYDQARSSRSRKVENDDG